jgi:hypothetical protein
MKIRTIALAACFALGSSLAMAQGAGGGGAGGAGGAGAGGGGAGAGGGPGPAASQGQGASGMSKGMHSMSKRTQSSMHKSTKHKKPSTM